MGVTIKRLGPGDEAILELIARDESDFDLQGQGGPREPLKPSLAQRYLANPHVMHWVALQEGLVTGSLYCALLLLRSEPGQELLLHEIGVREAWRGKGVGRALLNHMETWMRNNEVSEVWLCADNQAAVEFYRKSAFTTPEPQPLYMTHSVAASSKKAASTLISG